MKLKEQWSGFFTRASEQKDFDSLKTFSQLALLGTVYNE